MSASLSLELRDRFRECIEEGLSGRAAAARLKLSAATGVRWQGKLRETGSVALDIQGRPPGHGKLGAYRAFLEELVAQDGDITLPELAAALEAATGVVAYGASIGRFLRKLGYRYKKVTGRDRTAPGARETFAAGLVPASHSDHACASRQARVHCCTGHCGAIPCPPVDETAVKTNLPRLRGRSLRGRRLEMTELPPNVWPVSGVD